MWSDLIWIDGSVSTGSVDIEIVSVSETYVYKDLVDRHIDILPEELDPAIPDHILVASARTSFDAPEEDSLETVWMDFWNIFPTHQPIVCDVILHYVGTVPAHVSWVASIDAAIEPYLVTTWGVKVMDAAGNYPAEWTPVNLDEIQLHYSTYLKLNVFLDPGLLQDAGMAAQGLSGTFITDFVVHQWNEAP
jgi:hypothetical protein